MTEAPISNRWMHATCRHCVQHAATHQNVPEWHDNVKSLFRIWQHERIEGEDCAFQKSGLSVSTATAVPTMVLAHAAGTKERM
eukprot:3661415-Amphidinium_carterae.1